MKKIVLVLLLTASLYGINAQTEAVEGDKKDYTEFGIETDLFAWRIGELFENIYLGAWIGIPHWKFVLSGGAMNVNPGHLPDFVKSNTAYIAQLRSDWFINKDLKGFWIGPSLSAEFADVVSTEDYKSKIFIMSGGFTTGYLFKAEHVYFGPSVSIHFTIGNPQLTVHEGYTYPMPPWSFETGFRFGYQF